MTKLIRKTFRKIVEIIGYNGVCHECNSPISYDDEIMGIEIENTVEYWKIIPVDAYLCPYCRNPILAMVVYKSLNVSVEIKHD